MPRILLVAQDKGGSGKTVLVRALAECLPSAHLIEIEANRRLIELEDRVSFFPVRAERGEINRTGGAAARAEFDGPLNAVAGAQGPIIVDVGANTAGSLLPLIGEAQARYARRGVEFALLVVLTSEPVRSPTLPSCSISPAPSRRRALRSRTRSRVRSIRRL